MSKSKEKNTNSSKSRIVTHRNYCINFIVCHKAMNPISGKWLNTGHPIARSLATITYQMYLLYMSFKQ